MPLPTGRLSRRSLLQAAAAGGAAFALPAWGAPRVRHTTLVLVQLAGGNDGLNTVVPWRDASYRALRPSLAVAEDQLLRLSEKAAWHPSLEPLVKTWQAGELAVVEGVGYGQATRSHFASTDVWHAGSSSPRSAGWLGALLSQADRDPTSVADAITLSADGEAALTADGVRTLSLARPGKWLRRAQAVPTRGGAGDRGNDALGHLLATERDIVMARERLREQLRTGRVASKIAGAGQMTGGVRLAARLLDGTFGVRALHIKVGGFDTHATQARRHGNLLKAVANGLQGLRRELIASGRWNDVVVMTYSEFGRRVKENGSGGTDHGKAGQMFIMGGRVKGGLYGAAPSLTDLDDGDLRYQVDFRQVYATVARDLLGYSAKAVQGVLGRHKRLGFAA